MSDTRAEPTCSALMRTLEDVVLILRSPSYRWPADFRHAEWRGASGRRRRRAAGAGTEALHAADQGGGGGAALQGRGRGALTHQDSSQGGTNVHSFLSYRLCCWPLRQVVQRSWWSHSFYLHALSKVLRLELLSLKCFKKRTVSAVLSTV